MKGSYEGLYADTKIQANFVGGMPLDNMSELLDSGYVENPYYTATFDLSMNRPDTNALNLDIQSRRVVFTNNISRYIGEGFTVDFAEGFDETCMNEFQEIIILGERTAAMYGLSPGEPVILSVDRMIDQIRKGYVTGYWKNHPDEEISEAEILRMYDEEIRRDLGYLSRPYIVAGVVSTPSGRYAETSFAPGTATISQQFFGTVALDSAEVTLTDNGLVDEFRSFGDTLAGGTATSGAIMVMDTSKLENLRNTLRLLEMLYPIILAAALLIGGFLCALVIFQTSKEAAIMRVQGTTKGKTRMILALEQVILAIIGLLVGFCVLLIYEGAELSAISGELGLFAGLYFVIILLSAIVSASAVTRKNVLELLQTKE